MTMAAVLLCGGKASRMGFPKERLVRGDGKALLQVQVERLTEAGFHPVAIAGMAPGLCPDLPRLADAPGVEGPLAGLAPALEWSTREHVLVMAVDHGAMTGELLREMAGRLRPGRILAPRSDDGFESTLCFWPRGLDGELEAYLASGARSIHGFLKAVHDRVDVYPIPPDMAAFFANWNRREDLPEGWNAGLG